MARQNVQQKPRKLSMQELVNPLTPGTFCKKCVFWTFWSFLSWISAKLPLIQSKMHLQHNSWPFLPPASHFATLWLGHAQKSTYVFRLFDFWNFFFRLSFFSFSLVFAAVIDLLLGLLSEKASSRRVIFSMEHPGVVAGNFAPSFSLNFFSIFVHI